MSIPSLNPLAAPNALCPTCGNIIVPEPVRVGTGRVTEVIYSCVNPVKNCSWQTKATLHHISGEGPNALKPEEVEKRRKAMEDVKRYQEIRDQGLSELLAIAPTLKEMVLQRRSVIRDTPAPHHHHVDREITGTGQDAKTAEPNPVVGGVTEVAGAGSQG